MENAIVKKMIFYVSACLSSPLCVSGGDGILTDQDVIRDFDGNPFIPGSSLAGAMRGYLAGGKNQKCIFGYSDADFRRADGKMSSVLVSDFVFEGAVKTKVRDGVALTEGKTSVTGARYDMEVVDTGAKGYFTMEVVVRAQDDEAQMRRQLQAVFSGWNLHEIRLGAKKTRGYGELSILSVKSRSYTAENILEYRDAYSHETAMKTFEDVTEQWLKRTEESESQFITIELPLRLRGGISIRQYAAKKGEPDFVHITANGKPVIPGTSFAGAIRHRMMDILTELGAVNKKEVVDGVFGFVEQTKTESKAQKSGVVISECVIEHAKPLTMVRNGVSRFEAGTKTGALFKEQSFADGTTTLTIKVKKQKESGGIIGLLLLVLKDIQNGFLSIGGQTAVGRGIFEPDGELKVDGEAAEEAPYLAEAFSLLVWR